MLGCYLDDLRLESVNHKLDNPLAKTERLRLREQGEEPLAMRIRDLAPAQVVVVMKDIQETSVGLRWRLRGAVVRALPFPGRTAQRNRYIDELASIKSFRGRGPPESSCSVEVPSPTCSVQRA